MFTLRRLTPDDWATWREVRLAALADAPHAYGSTLAREQAFTEADWRAWLATGYTAVALVDGRPVGAIRGHTPEHATAVLLVAMWAHPDLRGRGVADALVTDLLRWAGETGWSRVELRVADGNECARRLFQRHGFAPTGRREPLESDPTVGTTYLARQV